MAKSVYQGKKKSEIDEEKGPLLEEGDEVYAATGTGGGEADQAEDAPPPPICFNTQPTNQMMNVDYLDDISKAVVYAQYGSSQELFALYEQKRIDVNQKDKEGCLILQWAAINNRVDIVHYLLKHGAFVNETGGVMGENALHWAVRQNHVEMVALLIASGADGRALNAHGQDAVYLGAQAQRLEALAYLLAAGLPPDTPDRRGYTPLMWACQYAPRHLALQRLLLAFGAAGGLGQRDTKAGRTALHLAVASSATMQGLRELVQAGAALDAEDAEGKTPLTMRDESGASFPCQSWLQELAKYPTREALPCSRGFYMGFYQLFSLYLLTYFFGWLWGMLSFSIFVWGQGSWCSRVTMNPENWLCFGLNSAIICAITVTFFIDISPQVPASSTAIFFALVLTIVYFLYKANNTNPGSPSGGGAAAKGAAVRALFEAGKLRGPNGLAGALCETCLVPKDGAAHHCGACGVCVAGFDHHCPWVGACVGRDNHRAFVGFLAAAALGLADFLWHAIHLLRADCGLPPGTPVWTGQAYRCLAAEARGRPPLALSGALGAAVLAWVTGLLLAQLFQIGRGYTTYDAIKRTGRYHAGAARVAGPADAPRCLANLAAFARGRHEAAAAAARGAPAAAARGKKADDGGGAEGGGGGAGWGGEEGWTAVV